MVIRKGTSQDLDELERLYDELNDYLEHHINYPGWRKGIYPVREDAVLGVTENRLLVAIIDGKIAGTLKLSHEPEQGYDLADWHNDFDYEEIFIVYTLAVHPQFMGQGVGRKLMEFVLEYAKEKGMKAVRLDVYEKNIPAIRLYESVGFQYIDTVDAGYSSIGLDWFKLYQWEV